VCLGFELLLLHGFEGLFVWMVWSVRVLGLGRTCDVDGWVVCFFRLWGYHRQVGNIWALMYIHYCTRGGNSDKSCMYM
jgi:hypothetical protein